MPRHIFTAQTETQVVPEPRCMEVDQFVSEWICTKFRDELSLLKVVDRVKVVRASGSVDCI
jgi:hypothetical protein